MTTQAITSIDRQHGYVRVTWETLGNADDGAPFQAPSGYSLESVQFTGTLGGATLVIQGSNDESTYAAVKSETALGFAFPAGQVFIMRPATSGGTGTDVDAVAYFRRR